MAPLPGTSTCSFIVYLIILGKFRLHFCVYCLNIIALSQITAAFHLTPPLFHHDHDDLFPMNTAFLDNEILFSGKIQFCYRIEHKSSKQLTKKTQETNTNKTIFFKLPRSEPYFSPKYAELITSESRN